MRSSLLLAVGLALVLCVSGVNATAVASCWLGPQGSVRGIITLSQATSTDAVTITGNLTSDALTTLKFHVQAYGDLYAGTSRGSCISTSDAAAFTITPDVTEYYAASTTSSSITLFGAQSIIGRSIGVFDNIDSCASASTSGTAIAQCVIGINSQYATSNEAIAAPFTSALPTSAVASVHLANGSITGWVTFAPNIQITDEVMVHAWVWGLVAGATHSIHVHWYGDMTTDDGLSMGGHLNSNNGIHGWAPSLTRHMGDIGNVTADSNGVVNWVGSFNLLNFNGTGNIIGRGLVFHALRDDGNPTGSNTSTGAAGARIGRGVIGISSRRPDELKPAYGHCWFGFDGAVTGSVTLGQINPTQPITITGSLSASTSSVYYIHVQTYGDLKDGTNGGTCYSGDNALFSFTSVAGTNTIRAQSSIANLFGAGPSIIGRTLSIYSAASCAAAVQTTPVAQCVVGIHSLGNTNNRALQILAAPPVSAYCKLSRGNADGAANIAGEVYFAPSLTTAGEMYVQTYVTGLVPYSIHAIHVHWFGDMSGADGLTMGGHLNPQNLYHGVAPSNQRHMGDIGNVTANSDGFIAAGGSYNLLHFNQGYGNIIGRGIVFHAQRDDGNPTNSSTSVGDAGARWARCVIGVSARQPTALPTQSSSGSMMPSSTGNTITGAAMPARSGVVASLIAAIVVAIVAIAATAAAL